MFTSGLQEEVDSLKEEIDAVQDKIDDGVICDKIRLLTEKKLQDRAKPQTKQMLNEQTAV